MDFSSDILIDFGLNLAGYLIVGLLVHLLLIRRLAPADQTRKTAPAEAKQKHASETEVTPVRTSVAAVPEFILLSSQNRSLKAATSEIDDLIDDAPAVVGRDATRRADRRAICLEAKRLLANGKSQGELMRRLPLTENEVEMLSAAGKA